MSHAILFSRVDSVLRSHQTAESITNEISIAKCHRFPNAYVSLWVESDNRGYFLLLEICTQCRRKLEEASLVVTPIAESAEVSEPIGNPSDVETEKWISAEDTAQVCYVT